MMLLDTSGLFCLLHRDERQHEAAQKVYSAATTRFTHNYVLDELVPLSQSRGVSRLATLDFSRQLLSDAKIEIVWVDDVLHHRALDLLFAREDKRYSLSDAVSFVLMRDRGETEALTTDRHFEQEGFVRLLAA
jgi:predicted nucleic acid-binding protein